MTMNQEIAFSEAGLCHINLCSPGIYTSAWRALPTGKARVQQSLQDSRPGSADYPISAASPGLSDTFWDHLFIMKAAHHSLSPSREVSTSFSSRLLPILEMIFSFICLLTSSFLFFPLEYNTQNLQNLFAFYFLYHPRTVSEGRGRRKQG